ncbi:MAG: FecR domain-containing protein [Spirochaetota bacterium]
MKKTIIALFSFLVIFTSTAVSQEKVLIKDIQGKVEVKTGTGEWQSVSKGTSVTTGTLISTGFNSLAWLVIGPSEIEVKPLTRMSIAEYIQKANTLSTSVDLKVGKVKVAVKTAEGMKHDFAVKSPSSTASVRGTEFIFDGFSIEVLSGMVILSMNDGTIEFVTGGERNGGEKVVLAGFVTSTYPEWGGSSLPSTQQQAAAGGVQTGGTLVVTYN